MLEAVAVGRPIVEESLKFVPVFICPLHVSDLFINKLITIIVIHLDRLVFGWQLEVNGRKWQFFFHPCQKFESSILIRSHKCSSIADHRLVLLRMREDVDEWGLLLPVFLRDGGAGERSRRKTWVVEVCFGLIRAIKNCVFF